MEGKFWLLIFFKIVLDKILFRILKKMIVNTIIARHSDGLFLAENYEGNDDRVALAKRKVKQLLKANITYEEDHLRKADVDSLCLL